MWEVEFISSETIKPSSPTPHHLRTFKLSMLDQLSPEIFSRLLLFYSSSPTRGIGQVIQKLKASLSETLTLFYPLAGSIIKGEDDDTVDCNDRGVDFLVTKVNGQLHEFLDDPNPEAADKFLPCDILRARSGREVLLAVQVNAFDCGGTAVGVGISHKLADGPSLASFVSKWAATAREARDVVGPTFDAPVLFPPTKVPRSVQAAESILSIKENLPTRRFAFDASNIARLRSRVGNGAGPTRVEAVSALIWSCLMRARGESRRALVVLHAVCMRKRMVPPLPESSFGNLASGAITSWPPEGGEGRHEDVQRGLVRQLRDATRVIAGDYIRELQGPYGLIKALGPLQRMKEKYSKCGVDLCVFSSWCKLPLYEVDFGCGRPIWACVGRLSAKDAIILMDSRSGDGIEAWICLEDEVMAKFERDQELLSFASLSTSIAA